MNLSRWLSRSGERAKAAPATLAGGEGAVYTAKPRSLRLAVQDVALSRRKQGFESPRERQINQEIILRLPQRLRPRATFIFLRKNDLMSPGPANPGLSVIWSPSSIPILEYEGGDLLCGMVARI